ncbi:MAG: hypothetical protein J3Q66DRAFT_344525 [Benniella sp.]|nr:MAG: hypothetical protein J3Q66DRAFT_344525 [Benniella sp.]
MYCLLSSLIRRQVILLLDGLLHFINFLQQLIVILLKRLQCLIYLPHLLPSVLCLLLGDLHLLAHFVKVHLNLIHLNLYLFLSVLGLLHLLLYLLHLLL